jgi:signal transduction histidine kinase
MVNYVNCDEGRRFLNIIRNSSNFLLFLVNDLLDFFQIKNGKFKSNLKWVDMNKTF